MTASAVVRWDAAISMWFATNDSPVWFRVIQAVSVLHTEIAVTLYGVALAYLLFVKREGFWSLVALCAIPSGMLVNFAIKHVFMRPRPPIAAAHQPLSTYSFPSGHTLGTTLFYGVVVCVLLSGNPGPARRVAAAGCAAMVVLVAFSRVYLGAHYPGDVVGAILEGIAWLSVVIAWRHARERSRRPALAVGY